MHLSTWIWTINAERCASFCKPIDENEPFFQEAQPVMSRYHYICIPLLCAPSNVQFYCWVINIAM